MHFTKRCSLREDGGLSTPDKVISGQQSRTEAKVAPRLAGDAWPGSYLVLLFLSHMTEFSLGFFPHMTKGIHMRFEMTTT